MKFQWPTYFHFSNFVSNRNHAAQGAGFPTESELVHAVKCHLKPREEQQGTEGSMDSLVHLQACDFPHNSALRFSVHMAD